MNTPSEPLPAAAHPVSVSFPYLLSSEWAARFLRHLDAGRPVYAIAAGDLAREIVGDRFSEPACALDCLLSAVAWESWAAGLKEGFAQVAAARCPPKPAAAPVPLRFHRALDETEGKQVRLTRGPGFVPVAAGTLRRRAGIGCWHVCAAITQGDLFTADDVVASWITPLPSGGVDIVINLREDWQP